jgi:hypothetical protein
MRTLFTPEGQRGIKQDPSRMCDKCAHYNNSFLEGKEICLGVVEYGRHCPLKKDQGFCSDFKPKPKIED